MKLYFYKQFNKNARCARSVKQNLTSRVTASVNFKRKLILLGMLNLQKSIIACDNRLQTSRLKWGLEQNHAGHSKKLSEHKIRMFCSGWIH